MGFIVQYEGSQEGFSEGGFLDSSKLSKIKFYVRRQRSKC